MVKTIQDCFGHSVRLTDERLEHILEHPEMSGLGGEIEQVLRTPREWFDHARMMRSAFFMSFTQGQLWVANGCVLS